FVISYSHFFAPFTFCKIPGIKAKHPRRVKAAYQPGRGEYPLQNGWLQAEPPSRDINKVPDHADETTNGKSSVWLRG
ncbi:hypothetical protein, partial [Candidatus Kuenenia stuttgartiensis]|uniref:hypothetical protein n=1 Tax=Kuenenia stuttgartiensis TaxID=174633 RepID=UPI001B8D9EEF